MYRRYERHFVILMYFCILLIAFLLSYVSRVTFPLRYVSLRYILIIYANPHTHTHNPHTIHNTHLHTLLNIVYRSISIASPCKCIYLHIYIYIQYLDSSLNARAVPLISCICCCAYSCVCVFR